MKFELACYIGAGVAVVVWTGWFVCHGRYWAKRTSYWDIPGVDKPAYRTGEDLEL